MLRADREKIIRAIEALEALQDTVICAAPPEAVSGRGRKSMGVTERKQVSLRMKKYWANRKNETTENRRSRQDLAAAG